MRVLQQGLYNKHAMLTNSSNISVNYGLLMKGGIICLDQCAWIALSDIMHGKHPFQNNHAVEPQQKRLFSSIFELWNQDKIIMPLTLERHVETLKSADPERRIKLAEFMVGLSRGSTMGPCDDNLIRMEIRNYLVDLHGLSAGKYIFPWSIMGVGLLGLLGAHLEFKDSKIEEMGPKDVEEIKRIEDSLKSPDLMVRILSDSSDAEVHLRDSYLEEIFNDFGDSAKTYFEALRSDAKRNKQRGATWNDYQAVRDRNLFLEEIVPLSIDVFKELGLENGPSKQPSRMSLSWDDFFVNLPSVYVRSRLIDERDRRFYHVDDPNDIPDLSFLSYSIPYGSIVVTDAKWADISRYIGLDKRFDTKILSVSEFVNADFDSITNF